MPDTIGQHSRGERIVGCHEPLSQCHSSSALDRIEPEASAGIHPDDAERPGIEDGSYVRISSRRGSISARARVTRRECRGAVFMPFHFREAAANLLTIDALDPDGKIPEFKFCAVRVERVSSEIQAEGAA